MTPIVPVYRPESAKFFIDPALRAPIEQEVEGVKIPTNYLKFGEIFDLLSISRHEQLEAAGHQDQTDTIDYGVMLSSVLLKLEGVGTVEVKTEHLALANMTIASVSRQTRLELEFMMRKTLTGALFTDDQGGIAPITVPDAVLHIRVTGSCNVQNGETCLHGKVTAFEGPAIWNPSLVGFKLEAYRANTNIAKRNQVFDQQSGQ
jgi:hypothetical protein